MKDKWINIYNQWLKGDSSPDDRHELEKRALDDPFIADALEGVELYHGVDRENLQTRLEQRLKSETSTKVFPLWKYAAAASIAIIAGSFFFLQPAKNVSKAQEAYALESTSPAIAEDIAAIDAKKSINSASVKVEETAVSNLISYDDKEIKNAEIKVSRSQPQVNQKRRAVKEEEAKEIPLQSESDIGISTETIITATGASDRLAVAHTHTIPRPSEMPLGLAESAEPMPESQRLKNPTGRTVSVTNGNKTLTSKNSTDINANNQANSADLSELENMLEEETSSDFSSESIDTIIPDTEQKAYDQLGNELEAYPLIGWASFDSILMTEMPSKDYLFMRGIKDGTENRLSLTIDSTGSVIQFDAGAMPIPNIERVIEKTGKWHSDEQSTTVAHKHKIMSKKE
jgi:hypothetical protein